MNINLYLKTLLVLFVNTFPLSYAMANHKSQDILFIGNSFTYGAGSAVQFYRSNTITDLNDNGQGGVPALFKSFTQQVGLDYEVYIETQPGSGLEFHIERKIGVIGRRAWDNVVMHGQSTLDFAAPNNPAKLIATSDQLANVFLKLNPEARIYLMATWSRADQTYVEGGFWFKQPIAQMAMDVRAGYNQAAANNKGIHSVIPVGEAWNRAMQTGIADPNPYDGIEFGKVNLWTYDHYHASTFGYYLEALVVFGQVTGIDPRRLGGIECSAFELGFSRSQAAALQQVAFEQLSTELQITPARFETDSALRPQSCSD